MHEMIWSNPNDISAENGAYALMSIFFCMDFPDVILSDNGSQFVSRMMHLFTDMLIAQTFRLRYHRQSNGVIENYFQNILKQILAKGTAELLQDLDRYLMAILFAYGKVPQKGSGYSSYKLNFSCSLLGPLSLQKDTWVRHNIPEYKTYNI